MAYYCSHQKTHLFNLSSSPFPALNKNKKLASSSTLAADKWPDAVDEPEAQCAKASCLPLPSFPDRQTQRKASLVPSVADENIIRRFSPLLSTDISARWQKQIKAWGYEWEIVKEFHISRPVKRFVQGTPIWCIFPCCPGQLVLLKSSDNDFVSWP